MIDLFEFRAICRRGAPVVTAAVACLTTITPVNPAHADPIMVQGVVGVETGVSDNLNAAPDEPPPGVPERDSGAYTTLSPGIVMLVDRDKQTHELKVGFGTTLFFAAAGSQSFTGRAEWRSLLYPTPVLVMRTFTQWLHSVSGNNLLPDFGAGLSAVSNQYGQATSVTAQEALSWFFARKWRLIHNAGGRVFAGFAGLNPFDGDATGGIDGSTGLGVERLWETVGLGVDATVGYVDFARPSATGAEGQALARAQGQFRTDLGRYAAASISVGATTLFASDFESRVRPIGVGLLGFRFFEDGSLTLGASRSVTPNLFIAHTVLTDQVYTNLNLPVPGLRDSITRIAPLRFTVGGGFARSRAIDLVDQSETPPWEVVQGRLTVSYIITPTLRVAATYSYTEQSGDPMIDNLFLPFSRHLVTIKLAGSYPEIPDVQTRLQRSQFFRVDETTIERDRQPGGQPQ